MLSAQGMAPLHMPWITSRLSLRNLVIEDINLRSHRTGIGLPWSRASSLKLTN